MNQTITVNLYHQEGGYILVNSTTFSHVLDYDQGQWSDWMGYAPLSSGDHDFRLEIVISDQSSANNIRNILDYNVYKNESDIQPISVGVSNPVWNDTARQSQ